MSFVPETGKPGTIGYAANHAKQALWRPSTEEDKAKIIDLLNQSVEHIESGEGQQAKLKVQRILRYMSDEDQL